MEKKKNWRVYGMYILVCLAAGGLSAFLAGNGMEDYGALNQPPLSPPGWVFPVVWTILYVLMGISAARVSLEGGKDSLGIFWVQLAVNFLWSIFFFGQGWYWFSFFWLVLLLALAAVMTRRFWKICPRAGFLQLPYLCWLVFAAYLNLGVALLNP